MARFVALAILLAIGVGIFAFMQMSNLNVANLELQNARTELDTLRKRLNQLNLQGNSSATELASCKAQVTELQTALDTAKKPAGRR